MASRSIATRASARSWTHGPRARAPTACVAISSTGIARASMGCRRCAPRGSGRLLDSAVELPQRRGGAAHVARGEIGAAHQLREVRALETVLAVEHVALLLGEARVGVERAREVELERARPVPALVLGARPQVD